jgi:hypothetical protein
VNSIYKTTTPLLRSEGGILQTDAAQLFRFDPIPAKAKKLGLLSIYKFSLKKTNLQTITIYSSQEFLGDRKARRGGGGADGRDKGIENGGDIFSQFVSIMFE